MSPDDLKILISVEATRIKIECIAKKLVAFVSLEEIKKHHRTVKTKDFPRAKEKRTTKRVVAVQRSDTR